MGSLLYLHEETENLKEAEGSVWGFAYASYSLLYFYIVGIV